MRNWLKYIVAAALALYAFEGVMKYGGIWHSQAHPTPGVEVTFSDGSMAEGALSQAWSGEWVIATSQGTELHFQNFRRLSVTPPVQAERLWFRWRVLLPLAVVLLACLLGLACWSRFALKPHTTPTTQRTARS